MNAIGCYTLMKAGVVVYVGISTNVPRRVSQHRCNGKIDFDSHVTIPTDSIDAAKTIEEELIERHRPACNRQSNPNYLYPTTAVSGQFCCNQ